MNRVMVEAFLDELNEIEKEAFVGKTLNWAKKLLTRGGAKGAKGVAARPAAVAAKAVPEGTVASGGGSDLLRWGEMDEATKAVAQRLKGPIGEQYRTAAQAAQRKPSPADIMKRMQSQAGPAPSVPGMPTGGGAGAPTPPAAVFGGAAPSASTVAKAAPAGRTRILTAEQIARNPQIASRQGLQAAGGTGLHPEAFQKGKFMGFSSGGKPVYAHVMRKFAQSGMFPHLLAKKRAGCPR